MGFILYLLFILIPPHRVLQLAHSPFECIYSDRRELLAFTQTAPSQAWLRYKSFISWLTYSCRQTVRDKGPLKVITAFLPWKLLLNIDSCQGPVFWVQHLYVKSGSILHSSFISHKRRGFLKYWFGICMSFPCVKYGRWNGCGILCQGLDRLGNLQRDSHLHLCHCWN